MINQVLMNEFQVSELDQILYILKKQHKRFHLQSSEGAALEE